MVVKDDDSRARQYNMHRVEKGSARLEAPRYQRFVQNIETNMTEHHRPVRVGYEHLVVMSGVPGPRLFIDTSLTSRGLTGGVRQDKTGLPGKSSGLELEKAL